MKPIRSRVIKLTNMRSDDFGHDCQALLVAESDALEVVGAYAERLIKAVEVLSEGLEKLPCRKELAGEYSVCCIRCDAQAQAVRILGGE